MRQRRKKLNHEGYKDPTAEKAIRQYNKVPSHVRETIDHLKAISSLLGFEIVELRDRRTGRRYKV